jgi:hypothetical protein
MEGGVLELRIWDSPVRPVNGCRIGNVVVRGPPGGGG